MPDTGWWERFCWAARSIGSLLAHRTREHWQRYWWKAQRTRTFWIKELVVRYQQMPADTKILATLIGTADDGQLFQTRCWIHGQDYALLRTPDALGQLKERVERELRDRLDRFLDPECRCKHGYHWKCSLHGTWEN